MKAWINHFALNIGAAIACVWYAIVPPQWTGHSREDLIALSETNPLQAFITGIRD